MATSLVIENHLSCAVCFELYINPHVLRCQHTYCLECIQQLEHRGQVDCPECRQSTTMKDVQKNFQLAGLIESLNIVQKPVSAQPTQQLKCDLCENAKKAVKSQCVVCEEYMCAECETAHKKSKASRNHKIKPVKEIMKSYQSSITSTIDSLKQEKVSVRNKSKPVRENIRKYETKVASQLVEVDKCIDKMIDDLENHRRDIKKSIKENSERCLNTISLHVELFDKCENDIQVKIDFLSGLVNSEDILVLSETANSVDIAVKEEIEKIKSHLTSLDTQVELPVTVKVKEFNPNNYLGIEVREKGVKSGIADTPIRQPRLFSSLTSLPYTEKKKINYKYHYRIEQICEVDNNLWCAVYDAIHVYNKDLVKVREIKHKSIDRAKGLTQTHLGHVIVACGKNYGLHQLDTGGTYNKQILPGSYSDVACYNGQLFALECNKCKIVVFEHRNNDWVKSKEIHLNHSNGSMNDRLCVSLTGICVSSWDNHTVSVYRHTGEFLYQSGEYGLGAAGKLNGPRVCDVDREGNVIVADCFNHRLQLCDPRGQWDVIELPGHIQYPVHVLVDTQSQTIWVATRSNIYKYQKV